MKNLSVAMLALFLTAGLAGCVTTGTTERVLGTESQVQLRTIQSRVFDTPDRQQTLRTVVATLQDLGFVLDKGDAEMGIVSATKLQGYQMRMTVTVTMKSEQSVQVRANAQYERRTVTDPQVYQQFFQALEKAMFLTAHLDE